MTGKHLPNPFFGADVSLVLSGMSFTRPAWVRFNRLRTGVGLFRSTIHKWGMALTAACECRAKEQTAEHVITFFPIYGHSNGASVSLAVDKSLVPWLTVLCPAI